MRGYFSIYSCFFFLFFQNENMLIRFLPLICLLSAPCQSLDGCSSSGVTLTLAKRAVLSNTPAYQYVYAVALRREYLLYSGGILNFPGFSIEFVKLPSSGRKWWWCQECQELQLPMNDIHWMCEYSSTPSTTSVTFVVTWLTLWNSLSLLRFRHQNYLVESKLMVWVWNVAVVHGETNSSLLGESPVFVWLIHSHTNPKPLKHIPFCSISIYPVQFEKDYHTRF